MGEWRIREHVSDEQLLTMASRSRGLAHRAPLAEWSKDHLGHSAIVRHTDAYAARARDFFAICDELERRGLKMPPCDCPSGSHDWERKTHLKPAQTKTGE